MATRTTIRAAPERVGGLATRRPAPVAAGLLAVQATAGNRAAASIVAQRKASCGCGCNGAGGCGGGDQELGEAEDTAQRLASPTRGVPRRRVVQRADLNVFGDGYAQPPAMQSDAAQIKGSQKPASGHEWFPASEDFKATAAGGPGAGTFASLLTSLRGAGAGSVNTLRIIGHATSSAGGVLGLTGTIDPPPNANVLFSGSDDVTPTTVATHLPTITKLRDRFARGGRIILVGCNAGSADPLMKALAAAFNVCVEGFSDEVSWCLDFNAAKTKINGRGKTSSLIAFDPLQGRTGCGPVGSLQPDKKECPPKVDPKPKPLCIPIGDVIDQSASFLDGPLGGLFEPVQRLIVGGRSDLLGLRPGDGLDFGTFGRRDRVRHLQKALNDAGASLLTDGMFGNGTRDALGEFRSRRGLAPAPAVDQATADSLESGAVPGRSVLEGLRRGDGLDFGTEGRAPRVAQLQGKLSEKGHPCAVDGMFGPKTGRSLTTFQGASGLAEQELVDAPTAEALENGAAPPDICPLGTLPAGPGLQA